MALIKSISGIRGTIGGLASESLSPLDLVQISSAYADFLLDKNANKKVRLVIARDARISGEHIFKLISSTLLLSGIDLIDLGLLSTPGLGLAVENFSAQGGIMLSASHNTKEWNALKIFNEKGEYLSEEESKQLLSLVARKDFTYPGIDDLGKIEHVDNFNDEHIKAILALSLVDKEAIERRGFKIVVDGINSVGSLLVPKLLDALGVRDYKVINAELSGDFAHNPEPLDEHLGEIKSKVLDWGADLGIVVDPDVDRLAFINEKGESFGEEYSLVAIADYVLKNYKVCLYQKISVSNLSSSRALKDLTESRGGSYYPSAVGELNVVNKMKEVGAAIGGEGNGGIIYPELHYRRDALAGIALFLSHLAQTELSVSQLKERYSQYIMIKDKISFSKELKIDKLFEVLKDKYSQEEISEIDGIKIDWSDSWAHLRASNTEPIIRLYIEAKTRELAQARLEEIKGALKINK